MSAWQGLCSVPGTEQILNPVVMVVTKSVSQALPKSHHWDIPETPAPCYAKFLLEFEEDNDLFQTQNPCNHLSFYSLTTGALKDRIPCPGIGLFLGVYEEPF